MAKNQSTYTLKIDAELGNLQTILNQAKKSIEGFAQSGNAPKGLEKAFEKINTLLGQITDKTGKPLDLKGLAAAGRDLGSVQEGFRSIIRLLGEFDDLSDDIKLSFLSGDEQKKIQEATKALSDYGKSMEEVAKKQKLLDAAQKTNTKDKATLDKAKKKVSGLQDEKTLTQARLSGAQTKLKAAQGMENANPKDIAKYEAEVEKLTAELAILDKNLGAANEELATAQDTYNSSAQSIKKMEAEIKRASGASLKQLKEEAAQLGISLEGLNGHDAAKQVEILTDRLEQFKQETMKGAKPAFDAIKQGCEKAEVAADGLQDELKEAVEATKEMDEAAAQRDAFETKIKSFLGLSGAAQVLRVALRDAMATITELDAVMGQMAVVTDLTVGDYWDQLPEYADRASKLGVSINSAYEAATLYYQQGLKANEVTALSEQTLKMAAIAGLDATDATDRMTAALRGFNMELNEVNAQNIADVYSELAAITAADVDEISTAMTKTASIASSAGMEFETTAAFLSQIIETTRESAETAGTAMKTVIARFQELKKSPSEIGEIDGEIVDANAIETALRSVGVSLRDSAGQFRELDDVFLELSSKWDTLDKNTQRYIATIAAGSRQQSRFIAMMSDYSRTQELVTAANTSAGASNKQFEKTMDTLEYKVNQLKNAWHEFTMGIMNSDLVKFGVDVLTKFLEVVNKATGALDGVGGSLTKIVSVVGIFKLGKQIFEKFMPTVSGFFANVTKEAYIGGLNAGKEFMRGLEDSKKQVAGDAQNEENEDKKSENKEGVKRTGWQKLGDKTIGLNKWQEAGEHGKKRKRALDELKELEKEPDKYNKKQKEVLDEGKKQWDAYGKAVSQVGQTITGSGMAMSAIGGILSSLGLEEVGDTLSGIGNWITIIGSGVSTLGPLIVQLVHKLIVGGASTMAAWAWIIGIAAAVTLLVVGIVALFKSIRENSPEGQLKKAKEAAEQAAEAAEKAKEAYEGLANAIETLEDKHKSLEELTRGTKEWNEAVLEINSSIMDLIQQYPELAKFVEHTDGVLKIDFSNQGVQDVLNKAFEASIGASNVAMAADVAVLKTERNNERSGINEAFVYDIQYTKIEEQRSDDGYIRKYVPTTSFASEGSTYENGDKAEILQLSEQQIDELSKGMANGLHLDKDSQAFADFLETLELTPERFDILWASIEDSSSAIIKYGRSLQQKEQNENLLYDSMATSIVNLVDTMGKSEERIKQMYNIADGEGYQEAYAKMEAKITDDIINIRSSEDETSFYEAIELTSEQVNEAFAQAGYLNATYDAKTRTVTYKNEDEESVEKTLENDEIRRVISTYSASEDIKLQAKYSDDYISLMSNVIQNKKGKDGNVAQAFEKALLDESGETLTLEDYNTLQKLTETDMKEYFEELPNTLKEVYGSVDNLWNDVKAAKVSASYLGTERGGQFTGVTVGAAKNLNKIKDTISDKKAKEDFNTIFNTIMKDLDTSQKEYFSQQIASLASDPTNREAWDAALERLTASGIKGEAITEFINNQQAALNTRYSDTYLKNMGVSGSLISQYTNASGEQLNKFHETFKKWKDDYDTVNSEAAKIEHELLEQTIEAIIKNREKQIEAYEDATNAQAEANSNLIAKISDNVARLRELREEEETKKAITDNLSKQAYLGMDTSGGNALEILRLQEENEQMAQDYEDQLVDQAINRLEEDNQKALEQREHQIELMRQQLDIYSHSDQILQEAKAKIEEAKNAFVDGKDITTTELGALLTPETFTSAFEESTFWDGLRTALSKLVSGEDDDGGLEENGQGAKDDSPDTDKQTKALNSAVSLVQGSATGFKGIKDTDEYSNAKIQYGLAGGKIDEFDSKVKEESGTVTGGHFPDSGVIKNWWTSRGWNGANVKIGDKTIENVPMPYGDNLHVASDEAKKAISQYSGGQTPSDGWIAMYGGEPYIYWNGNWRQIVGDHSKPKWEKGYNDLKSAMSNYLNSYETGGLADFTGPAWLDGTKSRPEYVLNATQTERFFSLVDILEGLDKKDGPATSSGDNYFDINISVEKLENDYDVEQVVDKIRRMIYEDATYRNVNAINRIR